MTTQTFYWHDYETFGLDPQRDRAAQFAGVRTDVDFNVIDEPLVLYCQSAADTLPHPDSCVITGITPQIAEQKGDYEAEFIRRIHEQLAQPNTCTLGYNNLRFDDEVTRNLLYRNFYDPYAREWQHGNSRWDLIDVVRAARALRPEGIQWVNSAEGKPSFRLDQLTIANGIAHEGAHDALADVYATIELAKLVKQAQPKLFQFLLENRVKNKVQDLLQLGCFKPVLHISGKYRAEKNCLAVVLPLCKHPTNANGVIVYDLSINPEALLSLSAADIQQRLFTATADLPEGVARIPLKTVHINKCPVLAPISVLKPADAERLNIDLAACLAHIEAINTTLGLTEKLTAVFSGHSDRQEIDPDLAIYSGGFFADADKATMAKIRTSSPEQLAAHSFKFTDNRLAEMLFRYRARNYPDTLHAEEKQRWQCFCKNRLTGQQASAGMTFDAYFARLNELKTDATVNQSTVQALETYALQKMQLLSMK
ncbi:MAG: exodeoxyribonuclease I [Methylococcales bacterium]|nr:exodeoxyribonuclease I [Methylococcales bacterium]